MNLDTQEDVSVSIRSIDGKMIATRNYGKMIGSYTLSFDVSSFAKGVYVIETIVGDKIIIDKFFKE